MTIIPELVEQNFSRYPDYYNDLAGTQQEVAERLSILIKDNIGSEPVSNILEIGCGTGFLTNNLIKLFPESKYNITDISSSMLEYCRNQIPEKENLRFNICDITKGCPDGKYNLITSSLAFQWIEDLENLVKDLHSHLTEKGLLCFTTLLTGTFENIEEIFDRHGVSFPLPELAEKHKIERALSSFRNVEIIEGIYLEKFNSVKEFLDHIHKIGAGNATGERIPVSKLREIIKEEEENGGIVAEYKVAFVVGKK